MQKSGGRLHGFGKYLNAIPPQLLCAVERVIRFADKIFQCFLIPGRRDTD